MRHFAVGVDENEDRVVAGSHRGQVGDEVKANVASTTRRDKEGLEKAAGFLGAGLGAAAVETRIDVRGGVRARAEPIVMAIGSVECLFLALVAGCDVVVVAAENVAEELR